MNIYSQKQKWKFSLFTAAILIGVSSLWYTNSLVQRLSDEERMKVELWAEATRQLASSDLSERDFGFLLQVIQNNRTVPVILTDINGTIISHRNLDSLKANNPQYLQQKLEIMKAENPAIPIDLFGGDMNYIYYSNSLILKKLTYYPYIQLGVILLFILVSYIAFSTARRAEQNQVWLGLTKETAHQLGTPTSSLLAWIEMLKLKNVEPEIVDELSKDVHRLEKITERFSKVGAKPVLKKTNIGDVLTRSLEYLKSRSSSKVNFKLTLPSEEIYVPLNASLFEWVIENICKNALDAIEGKGSIIIALTNNIQVIYIDITDSGKGISKNRYKTIFKPGFTTKERGWGLGLSLSKRIIEQYHNGKVFVQNSELNVGTTFRIILNKI